MIAKTGQIKHLQKFTDGTNTMLTVKGEQPDYVYLAVQNARCPQAEVYCKEGDDDKAIKDYNAAIKLSSQDVKPYVGLSDVYSRKKDFDKAINYLKIALIGV